MHLVTDLKPLAPTTERQWTRLVRLLAAGQKNMLTKTAKNNTYRSKIIIPTLYCWCMVDSCLHCKFRNGAWRPRAAFQDRVFLCALLCRCWPFVRACSEHVCAPIMRSWFEKVCCPYSNVCALFYERICCGNVMWWRLWCQLMNKRTKKTTIPP